jgi:hypothetical protein
VKPASGVAEAVHDVAHVLPARDEDARVGPAQRVGGDGGERVEAVLGEPGVGALDRRLEEAPADVVAVVAGAPSGREEEVVAGWVPGAP